jgi:hypothetical protein
MCALTANRAAAIFAHGGIAFDGAIFSMGL